MNWDFSYESFKRFGPDEPHQVNFSDVFPSGAYLVELPREMLNGLVDTRSVSLDVSTIKSDVSQTKWETLDAYIDHGGPLSPSWAVESTRPGMIFVAQGRHRFQWCIVNGVPTIPVVVNEKLGRALQRSHGLTLVPMNP